MDYTLEDLVGFIARNDEHRDYYQERLENLIREREAKAWDEGFCSMRGENPYRKAALRRLGRRIVEQNKSEQERSR